MIFRSVFIALVLMLATNATAQQFYFPSTNDSWERISPSALNWCADRIDSLVEFVGKSNGKALIILKDGRIALEQYYGAFTRDSLWYWASAGKTVTAALVGMAQEQGLMDITKPSATYLGYGWSSCTKQQEEAITVRHHLTMTSGLGFERNNDDCTEPACLTYRAAPGTIWDYHNAAYLLLQDMVARASDITYQQFYTRNLATKLGMGGLWVNGTLYSKPLAMARFGLMLLAGGTWNGDTVLRDREYFNAMISTSQDLNKSYGYLFWLNGKGSFMQPSIPLVYRTDLVPEAPDDMYAGMGKNDQRVYVVPSKGLVVVRMGDKATESLPAISGFDDDLWKHINELECTTTVSNQVETHTAVWPNPTSGRVMFTGEQIKLYDMNGAEVYAANGGVGQVDNLARGMYRADVFHGSTITRMCIVKY